MYRKWKGFDDLCSCTIRLQHGNSKSKCDRLPAMWNWVLNLFKLFRVLSAVLICTQHADTLWLWNMRSFPIRLPSRNLCSLRPLIAKHRRQKAFRQPASAKKWGKWKGKPDKQLYQWILRICKKGQKLKKHAFGSQTFVALRRTLAGSLHAEK